MEKNEIAKEALKALSEIEETVKMEDLVKDNKIEWKVNDIIYRVRKPNAIEQDEISTIRRKKYLEFIKDPTYLFKKQWIIEYKTKGIDINEMENKVRLLDADIKDSLLRLAKSQEPKDISILKDEILKKRDEQFSISIEITDLLTHSIENQLMVTVNSYMTYLVLEKKDGENWTKVYKDYSEFMKDDNECIASAFYYLNHLVYQNSMEIKEKK